MSSGDVILEKKELRSSNAEKYSAFYEWWFADCYGIASKKRGELFRVSVIITRRSGGVSKSAEGLEDIEAVCQWIRDNI